MTADGPAEGIYRLLCRAVAAALLGVVAACSGEPSQPVPLPLMPTVAAPQHPAAEPVEPSPAPLPPPPVLAGHVASYRTLAEAEAAVPRLIERFPVLRDEPKRLVEIDLGPQRGKVVRLLVGGFLDQSETSRFCHKLRGSGVFCAPHDLPPETSGKSGA